ncbi:ubiquitin-like domain-containing protein [Alkalibacillus haloalkaliphilus]|uniref:ubiquitin-like domain-containing protein n=1 Tax=Alkalibacillus haloalkaliphilus TaxID=94136 RepID=UPI0029355B9B|nr:ubiquitin-like domain-containing protein [Alkalibacillus haloalkaliphilus]MDV2583261.1 ubiquitin-like domain-containing protein [Alkalibacillus haloalkaliphilus]
MAGTEQAKKGFSRFGFKQIALTLFATILVLASITFFVYDSMRAEVTVVLDDEEQTVVTTADTVDELLDELDVEVGEHDHLSVDVNADLEDGMDITYEQAREVIVTMDQRTEHYYTTENTVEDFLNNKDIELSEHDQMSVSLNDSVHDQMHIAISSAFEVKIVDGGEEKTKVVTNQTVQSLLNQEGIDLSEHDKLNVEPSQMVRDQRDIEIVRVSIDYETVEESVPYTTETREDDSMLQGENEVVQLGEEGKKVQEYEVVKENGEVVSRELVDEEIVEESVNRVVMEGTKQEVQLASSSSGEFQEFTSTKYTANCSGCSGVTATGVDVNNTIHHNGMRVIAVDPSVIPLYSIVEVKTPSETFTAIALDTGGAIVGNKIDILVDSRSEAMNWGRRTVQVRVIE